MRTVNSVITTWHELRSNWQRMPGVSRVVGTARRYVAYRGYQQAAAITYFTVLSLLPMAMVTLSLSGYALSGHGAILDKLHQQIDESAPALLRPLIAQVVDTAINHRFGLGAGGVAVAAYSGWNWMNTVRDALTGMFTLERVAGSVVRTVVKDFVALIGLVMSLLATSAVAVAGTDLGLHLLGITGLANHTTAVIVDVSSHIGTWATSWLIFWWILTALPRVAVSARTAAAPALAVVVAIEVLKQVANVYLQALGNTPTGITFGSAAGVLVFIYLVSRVVMLAAAWIATAPPRTNS